MIRGLAIAALACAMCGLAAADPDADAERALAAAQQRAAAGDDGAIDDLESLGRQRPITRWTDDAWRSAAQLAERGGDFARARHDLEQVIATSTDEHVIRRARADLERFASFTGERGEWDAVAAAHEQLLERARRPGDPAPVLRDLEALVRAHPGYPRAAMVMLALARAWERAGKPERAIGWLREAERAAANPQDRLRASAELARALLRHGDLDEAHAQIEALPDAMLAGQLRAALATARLRRTIRWSVIAVLVVIGAIAAAALRREAGTWRAVLRRLARPPIEVWFLVPVAGVLVAVAETGNSLVARAVVAIAIAGTVVAWISGAILDGAHARPRRRRMVLHVVLAMLAVLAAVYLAIDRDRMIDLVVETWRGGPAMR